MSASEPRNAFGSYHVVQSSLYADLSNGEVVSKFPGQAPPDPRPTPDTEEPTQQKVEAAQQSMPISKASSKPMIKQEPEEQSKKLQSPEVETSKRKIRSPSARGRAANNDRHASDSLIKSEPKRTISPPRRSRTPVSKSASQSSTANVRPSTSSRQRSRSPEYKPRTRRYSRSPRRRSRSPTSRQDEPRSTDRQSSTKDAYRRDPEQKLSQHKSGSLPMDTGAGKMRLALPKDPDPNGLDPFFALCKGGEPQFSVECKAYNATTLFMGPGGSYLKDFQARFPDLRVRCGQILQTAYFWVELPRHEYPSDGQEWFSFSNSTLASLCEAARLLNRYAHMKPLPRLDKFLLTDGKYDLW